MSKRERLRLVQFMLDFANIITPPNWNVVVEREGFSYKPRTLNVCIDKLGLDEYISEGVQPSENEFKGAAGGELHYSLISQYKDSDPKAAQALEKFGDRKIAYEWMYIYPVNDWRELIAVVADELSHIAYHRYLAWKKGLHRRESESDSVTLPRGEAKHGASVQRLYRTMILRAEKELGKEDLGHMWQRLDELKTL